MLTSVSNQMIENPTAKASALLVARRCQNPMRDGKLRCRQTARGFTACQIRVARDARRANTPDIPSMTNNAPLIVVGVDGSESARHALGYAVEEARLRGARLLIVSAWSVPVMVYAGGYTPGIDPGTFKHAAMTEAENALAEVRSTAPALEVEAISPNASAADALLAAAEDAQLLVVGARGIGGFERLLLGSVSQQVALHAPCIVTIVRPDRSHD
jgi:nucleotide-binding universal stress UspA family protein